ncbi:TldD/PmbA family protein [Acidiferrimicrobium sp. IK]|uniref:TldD/PmbA family protein n=1 Tax=Acidiferrimicrobium sp. IK TaxID=2871700 RepID=UPI0021CB38DD|nr:TldD/PmbA family protein [Acidiferrimicrobium sp. IK]MCU4182799.1 TldD/PmbA family protein [Acidiferrimicrobium sp. IK]
MSTELTELDAIGTKVVEMVGGRADAVVTVTSRRQGLTRFANSFIHQNVGDEHVSVDLRVTAGGRSAGASTTGVDDAALRRLVGSALDAAAVQPVDDDWPGLAPPSPLLVDGALDFDPATAAAGPGARADVVDNFVAAGGGAETAGFCETAATDAVLVNSAGQRVASSATSAAIDGIVRSRRADGVGSTYSSRLADLDGAACGAAAASTALTVGEPVDLAPGRYEVVLSPRCVAYMLDFFTIYGFNARAVQEGRSFASVGEVQLDSLLSLWDDATDPRHVGLGFDAEGTPKRRLDLVESGKVVGLAHDRRTAAKDGVASTGHAVPGGAAIGAVATNLFLAGGRATPVEDMVRSVRRGLLVKDFWYTRVLDPRTLVVTGLTRNGVFLIEDGAVGPPVANLRFTQSPVAAFGPGQVLGVGDDAVLAPGGLHTAWHHAPSLHLAAWNFTGGASG